jgi:hypothetical protein
MDVSGAVLLQFVLIKQTRPFAVEIEAAVFQGMSGIESSFSSDSTYFFACFLFVYASGPVTRNIFTVFRIFLVFETLAGGNFSSEFTTTVVLRMLLVHVPLRDTRCCNCAAGRV